MDKKEIKDRLQERYKRGAQAEIDFLSAFQAKYPNVQTRRSSREQDMFDHIDIFAGSESYDVKSLKKKSSRDNKVSPDIVWVELKNVRGKSGWLYGKATRIAFELEKEFILVNREMLKAVTESLIINKFVSSPQAYHLYGRNFTPQQEIDRGYKCQDVMTFLYLSDIEGIIIDRLPKAVMN